MASNEVQVIGGGLAGSEAAWQLAERGHSVVVHEMRPVRGTAAHRTEKLGELVCSNTFKSTETTNAHGLLKAEMRQLGSLILDCADHSRVPGGSALTVDREIFSQHVQDRIYAHPRIRVSREEVTALPEVGIIATGPLTSDALADAIRARLGVESLAFYDAIAPVVSLDSIDQSIAFRASRWGKETMDGAGEEGAYLNCAFTRDEYEAFIDALATDDVASRVPKEGKEEWPKFTASLSQVREMMRTMKPHNAVEIAIDGWYGDYLKGAYANYVSRLDDLKSLIGFAGRFEEMQELLAQIMLLNSETSDRSADPDADSLRLTTVHQAKGLEYAAVFLIGLADGSFPLRRAIEAGDVEEERRLFYVAVTRARDELYLCFPKVNTKGGPAMLQTPSRFLLELPSDLYQPLRVRRTTSW